MQGKESFFFHNFGTICYIGQTGLKMVKLKITERTVVKNKARKSRIRVTTPAPSFSEDNHLAFEARDLSLLHDRCIGKGQLRSR